MLFDLSLNGKNTQSIKIDGHPCEFVNGVDEGNPGTCHFQWNDGSHDGFDVFTSQIQDGNIISGKGEEDIQYRIKLLDE